jgi:aromatic-L-amino-acid decarboxylase
MTPDEFRTHGKELIDWIADYWEQIESHPVRSQVEPGWVRSQLPTQAPEKGEPFAAILRDLDDVILPGITHWQHPGFHAYFNSGGSAPSVLAELAAAGLGVQGMLWITSPAATELETVVLDWLATLLGLPTHFRSDGSGGGVIQDSASSSTLVAIIAARERALGGAGNRIGMQNAPRLRAYTSTHTHSSIEKGIRAAGLGSASVHPVAVDATYAMEPKALRAAIAADLEDGEVPAIVVATIGTTSSTALDPVRAIGEICEEYGIWLHVDAALAGTAAILPEMQWLHDGLEYADSYVMNPHKWMLTNMDCSALWVREKADMQRAFSINPEYLRTAASTSGQVIDYRDWQLPLGRRFRALKLWFVLRSFGAEGVRAIVREHLRLTELFAGLVQGHPDFEVAAPHPVNLVCFRHVGGDAANQRIMDSVNDGGEAFFTHTVLDGKLTLRMAIGAERTTEHHVRHAWDLITAAAR